jgi:hypothetical protein
MAGEVYRIGIEIALVGGIGAGLAAIAGQLTGINAKILEGEKGFARWGLLLGAGGIAGGIGILDGMKKIADQSERLNRAQNQLYRTTQSWSDVANVTAAAYDRITKAVPTASASDVVRAVSEARSVYGSTDAALTAAPMMLRMEELIRNLTGKDADGQGFQILRALEMKGITMSDPAGASALGEQMVKAIAGSGGKITASTFQDLAKRGGAAWMAATPDAVNAYSVAAADLGGGTAGTALMTLDNLRSGATTLSRQQLEVLQSSGLVDMSKVHKIPGSNAMNIEPGAIYKSAADQGNLYQWAQDISPKLHEAAAQLAAKDGVTEGQAFDSLIAKLGRNRNAIRMLHMFMDPGFMMQQEKDIGLWGAGMGLNQSYAAMLGNTPNVAGPGGWNDMMGGGKADYGEVMTGLQKQFQSLMEAVGGPVAQAAIPELKSLTDTFNSLGAFANAHPEAIQQVAKGVGVLGLALAGLGTAAVIAGAIALAGPVGVALAALGTGLGAMVALGPQTTAAFDSLNGLAAKLKGAIDGAFTSVDSMLVSAIQGIPGALAGAIRALPGELLSVFKGGPGAPPPAPPPIQGRPMHPSGVGPQSGQYPRQGGSDSMPPIHVKSVVMLDGRVLAEAVSHGLGALATFPQQAASADTYASYVSPDFQTTAG